MNETETKILFAELADAFEKSDIKQYAQRNNHTWNYSLTSTPIYENGLLLIGFNGGAIKGYPYERQDKLPTENFLKQDLGSFKRVIPFLKKYFDDETIDKVVQINYCFFRSAKEFEITARDRELCEPIFFKLLALIKPKQVISFSASLRQHLLNRSDIFENKFQKEIQSNRGGITAMVGELKINSNKIPIGFLPHPNYPLNGTARQQVWETVFENLNMN